jgi:hypothetical protein
MGHQIIDARTMAKQQAFPSREGMQAVIAMDSELIRPKSFMEGKHPMPKNIGQNPKAAAGGKVVDPTAIETFQGADATTIDAASGGGNDNVPILEGG